MKRSWVAAAGGLMLMVSPETVGHRPSDAYLTLKVDGARLDGQWEVALRDLELLASIDANGDRQLAWGELRASRPALERALLSALRVLADGAPCGMRVEGLSINDRLDGRFAWFDLAGECGAPPRRLAVRYELLFGLDPSHRGVVLVESDEQSHAAVLAPERRDTTFVLAAPSRAALFVDYWREGIHHIWAGFDHILFLVVLLLPSVLVRDAGAWRAASQLSPALWDVARVVTAFTLAHSVTLSLAATGWLRLPTEPVEVMIAGSVVLAALNNVFPLVTRARWGVALAFGLIHGLGFASILSGIGLPPQAQLSSLVAFNVGVEVGQLAIVMVLVPLAFALRRSVFYRRGVMVGGSLATAAIAAVWLGQRAGWIGV